jgi:hypothetical protein
VSKWFCSPLLSKSGCPSVLLAKNYYYAFSCVATMPLAPAAGLSSGPPDPASAGNTTRGGTRNRLIDRFASPIKMCWEISTIIFHALGDHSEGLQAPASRPGEGGLDPRLRGPGVDAGVWRRPRGAGEAPAMKPPRPRARPTIFVGLDENRVPPVLIVKGITWPRRGDLGRMAWAASGSLRNSPGKGSSL